MTRHRRGSQHRELKERLVRLLGGRCEVCGYSRCMAALEFHHRDPRTKRFSIGAIKGAGRVPWEKIVREAEKCILLCANCHREYHFVNH